MFILLAVLLSLFIILFLTITIFVRKMNAKQYNKFCERKIQRIARRYDFLNVTNLNIANFNSERIKVDQIIFGKKYIYLITDLFIKGFVNGEVSDNSWMYFSSIERKHHYLNNLNEILSQNIAEFVNIFGIKNDPIIPICLIPNECEFKIKNLNNDKKLIVNYCKFTRTIRRLEKENIGSLEPKQIYEHYKTIKNKNEQENKR